MVSELSSDISCIWLYRSSRTQRCWGNVLDWCIVTIEVKRGSHFVATIGLLRRIQHLSQCLVDILRSWQTFMGAPIFVRRFRFWCAETCHCFGEDYLLQPISWCIVTFLRRELRKKNWFASQTDVRWSRIISLPLLKPNRGLPCRLGKVHAFVNNLLRRLRLQQFNS